MGVPPTIEVLTVSTAEASARIAEWDADPRVGIVVAGDIETIAALTENCQRVKRINVGGIHQRPGRSERLRFVFLSDVEATQLKQLAARGIDITAQDVPTARAVPLAEFT